MRTPNGLTESTLAQLAEKPVGVIATESPSSDNGTAVKGTLSFFSEYSKKKLTQNVRPGILNHFLKMLV